MIEIDHVEISSLKDSLYCRGFKERYKYLYLNKQLPSLSGLGVDYEVVTEGLLGRMTLTQVRERANCCQNQVSIVIEMEALRRYSKRVCDVIFKQFEIMQKQQLFDSDTVYSNFNTAQDVRRIRQLAEHLSRVPSIKYEYIGYRSVTINLNKRLIKKKFEVAMYELAITGLLPHILRDQSLRDEIHEAQRYFTREKTLAELNQQHRFSLEASRKHLYRFVLKLESINRNHQKLSQNDLIA